jgi:hypothetical protein
LVLISALAGCAGTVHPGPPAFVGQETESWIAFDLEPVDRDPGDLLPSFEASARAFGCRTEQLGGDVAIAGGASARLVHGISASCDEGTLALITLQGSRVRIGCEKPIERRHCEELLRKIAEAR